MANNQTSSNQTVQAAKDIRQKLMSGQISSGQAQQQQQQNTQQSLQNSQTINRYAPATANATMAQQSLNKKYNLSPVTGQEGFAIPGSPATTRMIPSPNAPQNVNVKNRTTNGLGPNALPNYPAPMYTAGGQAQGNFFSSPSGQSASIQSQSVNPETSPVPAPSGLSGAQNQQSPTTTPGVAQQFPAQQSTAENQTYAQTPQEAQFAGNTPQGKAKVKSATVNPQQNQNRTALTAQAEKDNAARKALMGGNLVPPLPGAAPTGLNTSNPQDLSQWQNADPGGFEQWNQEKGWTSQTDKQASQQSADQVSSSLDKLNETSMDEQWMQLLGMSGDTTGATLLKMGLMAQMMAIEDPSTSQYLDRMEARALSSYKEGQDLVNLGESEINQAIDGTLEAPQTEAGLIAKVNKQTLDMEQANLANDQAYYKQQNEANLKQLRDNRADMEGYTKAKLYSMGAEDSSAGITLLSKTLSAADLQIQLAQSDYNHGLVQLNLQGTKIMNDYQNAVTGQVLSMKGDRQNLLATYNSEVDKIDESRFMDEKEKRNAKASAIGKYTTDMSDLMQKQKSFEFEQMKFAYQQTQDLKDDAIKYSGLTGTIWVPTDKGPVDTGMPTFDASKWGQQMQLTSDSERQSLALNLLGAYGSGAAPAVEQLLEVPEGSLKGQTLEEVRNNLSYASTMSGINRDNAAIAQGNAELNLKYQAADQQNALANSFLPSVSEAAKSVVGTQAFSKDFQSNPALQGGSLGCAWVASSILKMAGALTHPVQSINELEKVVANLGWTKSQQAIKDSLVIWGPSPTSQGHRHVGVVTGKNSAVDNWGQSGPHNDTIKQPDRAVETFWNPPIVHAQNTPQQNKSNFFSSIASAFVGAFYAANATPSQKAFASTAGVPQPQMPQYQFSLDQSAKYERYMKGDMKEYNALATNDSLKQAWGMGYSIWLTQHPEFETAVQGVDKDAQGQVESHQSKFDSEPLVDNFLKNIQQPYANILAAKQSGSHDLGVYKTALKQMAGSSEIDPGLLGNINNFLFRLAGQGNIVDQATEDAIFNQATYLYNTAYQQASQVKQQYDSQSPIASSYYQGGYKVHLPAPLQYQNPYTQMGQGQSLQFNYQ